MLTICEPAGQHLGHQAVLLIICEPVGQHLDHQAVLLTICEHIGDLLTLSVHDGQHLQDAIRFCKYGDADAGG